MEISCPNPGGLGHDAGWELRHDLDKRRKPKLSWPAGLALMADPTTHIQDPGIRTHLDPIWSSANAQENSVSWVNLANQHPRF